MSRSTIYVQCCYDTLRQAFEDIDQLAELADDLKDQRKYQEIVDCAAAVSAFTDEADGRIVAIGIADGLDIHKVCDAIMAGRKRARISREYREQTKTPSGAGLRIRSRPPRPKAQLEASTMMALDWMVAGERWGEVEAFLEGKSVEEIELIREYVKNRSGAKHGGRSQ